MGQAPYRKDWPASPQGVGRRLDRSQPQLNQAGIVFHRKRRTGKRRLIVIECVEPSMLSEGPSLSMPDGISRDQFEFLDTPDDREAVND